MTFMVSLILFNVTKVLETSGVISESYTICETLNGDNIQFFLALLWDTLDCMTSSVL